MRRMVEGATPDAPPLFREVYVGEGDPSAAILPIVSGAALERAEYVPEERYAVNAVLGLFWKNFWTTVL